MAKGRLSRIPQQKPIVIGCFTLTETGMDVRGKPSFADYEGVGEFIKRAVRASSFWMADWLRYGESRADWGERLSQVVDATGLSEKTVRNIRAVGKIDASRRRDDVEFAVHAEVAGLAPADQSKWLEKAAVEGYTVRDLRLVMRSARRRAVIDGQAVLEGLYRVIYADPAWLYDDRQPSGTGQGEHYPGMTIAEIGKLPIEAHAMPNAVLFLWITAPMALQNPGPRDVGEAWGFDYKQQIIWDKVEGAGGNYTQGNHEILTVWTRGKCVPDVQTDLPDSVQTIRKSRVHSEKPEEFRKLIEKHYTSGPYLELFGREPRAGWTVFGNDAALWGHQAATA